MIASSSKVPTIVTLNTPAAWLALIGLVLTIVLLVLKVKEAILISIVATALLEVPMGLTFFGFSIGFTQALSQLSTTFGATFGLEGRGSLFSDMTNLPLVLMTIFAFSLSNTFDTIGTFIGTSRKSGVFSQED